MVQLNPALVELVIDPLEVLNLSLLVSLDSDDDVLSISLVLLLEHKVLLSFPKRCLSGCGRLSGSSW